MWILSLCSSPHPDLVLEFERKLKPDPPVKLDDIPVDVARIISGYIEDPIEYFRFKRLCRRFSATLSPTFTVSGKRLWMLRNSRSPLINIELASDALIIVPPLCPELVEFYQTSPRTLLNAMQLIHADADFVNLFQPPVIATDYFLAATASHSEDFIFLKKLAMVATSGYDVRMYHVFLNLARDSHFMNDSVMGS